MMAGRCRTREATMPEKGAGVSLKDFSRGSVVEGQEGKEMVRGRRGKKPKGLRAHPSLPDMPRQGTACGQKNGKGRSLSRPA